MSIGISTTPVKDEQEALFLMFHHLQLAAAYFEATPTRIAYSDVPETFSEDAMREWLSVMDGLYPQEED